MYQIMKYLLISKNLEVLEIDKIFCANHCNDDNYNHDDNYNEHDTNETHDNTDNHTPNTK